MSNRYRLVGVGNAELVAGLSKLVQQSNALTAQVLAHLVELDERHLHLELGFASLFAYCVEGLGMSEGAAGRRVTAARVCRRFPDAFERMARGDLHLCALCALASHLNQQNAAELFEVSKGKTRRQVEELLAARFPRPDVRDQIRRLPAHVHDQPPGATLAGDTEPSTVTGMEALKMGAEPMPPRVEPTATHVPPRPRSRELEPLSTDRFGVHFTADAELCELIERARALASHRVSSGDLAGLMKLIVASFVKQEEKRRFGVGTKPRRAGSGAKSSNHDAKPADHLAGHSCPAEPSTPPGGALVLTGLSEAPTGAKRHSSAGRLSRYLRMHVRRLVHERDGGRCAYVSPDGRRCNARALIQFDHVDPFARNGSSDAPNLRSLCKAHNLLHARKCFGKLHMATKFAARSRGAREPRPR